MSESRTVFSDLHGTTVSTDLDQHCCRSTLVALAQPQETLVSIQISAGHRQLRAPAMGEQEKGSRLVHGGMTQSTQRVLGESLLAKTVQINKPKTLKPCPSLWALSLMPTAYSAGPCQSCLYGQTVAPDQRTTPKSIIQS